MISKRIIPSIIVYNGVVTKDRCWKPLRVINSIESQVDLYNKRGADELAIFNLTKFSPEIIQRISDNNFVPLMYSGDINTLDKAIAAIRYGADKVGITYKGDLSLYKLVSKHIGKQSVVAIFTNNYKDAKEASKYVGEIIFLDPKKEGRMLGMRNYDIKDIKCNVIAGSGCSSKEEALSVIKKYEGICIGSLFAFRDNTPRTIKEYLYKNGINIRRI